MNETEKTVINGLLLASNRRTAVNRVLKLLAEGRTKEAGTIVEEERRVENAAAQQRVTKYLEKQL